MRSTPCSTAKRASRRVLLRERGDAQGGAGEVQALVGSQPSTEDDPAAGSLAVGFLHPQFQLAVVQEDPLALPQVGQDLRVGHRQAARGEGGRGEDDLFARPQEDAVGGQFSQPQFGALQVGHDGQQAALFLGYPPRW